MKKLFISICFILFWCNLTFAERVTLGFAGDSCKQFNDSRKDFGKEFDDGFKPEIMGFLTGINIYIADIDGNTNRVKVLDHNSLDYAYSSIIEYCRKKSDGYVFFFGLIDYYYSLPTSK